MGNKWIYVEFHRKFFHSAEKLILDLSLVGQLVLQALKTETK